MPALKDDQHNRSAGLVVLLAVIKVIAFMALLTTPPLLWGFAQDWLTDGPKKRASLNRDIFAAFHAIERQCRAEAWPHQTVRCQGALEKLQSCRQSSDDCTATDFYCTLFKLGFEFELPSYYRSDSAYHDKSPC